MQCTPALTELGTQSSVPLSLSLPHTHTRLQNEQKCIQKLEVVSNLPLGTNFKLFLSSLYSFHILFHSTLPLRICVCLSVSQPSCITLPTRCVSAWLSSPCLYVISPGVLCVSVGLTVCLWCQQQQPKQHRSVLTSLRLGLFT